jgi:hypothetical protein
MMRIARAIAVGWLAALTALAVLSAPALAKHSDAPKTEDQSASPTCHSYEQDPNGDWKPVPCQEGPEGAAQRKSSPASADNAAH